MCKLAVAAAKALGLVRTLARAAVEIQIADAVAPKVQASAAVRLKTAAILAR